MTDTDITALVERLRSSAPFTADPLHSDLLDAADALEALQARAFIVAWRWRWKHEPDCWHFQTDHPGQLDARTVLEPLYAHPPAAEAADALEAMQAALAEIAALPAVDGETEKFRMHQEVRLNEQARQIAIRALAGDKP